MKYEYPLDEAFETIGTWWLPATPDRPVPGLLSYSITDMRLTLYGDIAESGNDMLGLLGTDFTRLKCVHGLLNNGKKCTLWKVIEVGRSSGPGRNSMNDYKSLLGFVGGHLDADDVATFSSISMTCSHLNSFIAPGVLSATPSYGDDRRLQRATLEYVSSDKVSARITSIAATLELDVAARYTDNRSSITLSAESNLDIIPDEPQTPEWYLLKVWRACYLLTLLTDELVSPTMLRVSPSYAAAVIG